MKSPARKKIEDEVRLIKKTACISWEIVSYATENASLCMSLVVLYKKTPHSYVSSKC